MVALADRGRYIQQRQRQELTLPLTANSNGIELINQARCDHRHPYEHESKQLLEQYGVAVPAQQFVSNSSELSRLSPALNGRPLAMKVVSRDILHKSDAGGV